ncbi:alpha/beta fold hydrolase [Aldersonia sp. NBC_00410]|uniref:alpha/beta fold hydrolase n=1 Tax=Aldersonia sp. NBC_00410 TaxID=2975954 RepID=UPI00225265AA|nr:alpha/beta fold hydrolase [Aldersonia sp. NBC_00410]MCX5046016.1 alpha/beta fold hydrolase [Aldersonia sp. NBC_00410]
MTDETTRPGPQTVEIHLPEVSLTALCWGPEDGPLAVCLHGYPDTAWTWRHLGPVLAARGWRVVAPFTRGYAPSEIPRDGSYHVGALMDDAIGVHRALGGDERAVVIGHDWGAITANGLGAFPESPFRRVVSLAVPPIPAMQPERASWRRTPRFALLLLKQSRMSWYIAFNQIPRLAERSLDRLIPLLWRHWSPGYDATEDLDHVMTSLASPANRAAALGYYRAVAGRRKVPARYRDAQRYWISAPEVQTLYLHGDDDGCLAVGLTARVGEALPAGSEVVHVANAGHFLQLEQPETVHQAIVAFVEQ